MPTLDFKGKQFVHAHHLGVPFRELKLVPDKSVPPPGGKPSLNDNLVIHGDNLEALKALLPIYGGKVDCVFIDPPYNTGNEGWCYDDNLRSPLMKEWLKKAANPVEKEDMERHDKWLCMMWPRLQLLKELLSESGVIFISIDDHEQHRLRALLDEIFGEDNFIASIVWQRRTSPESRKRLGAAHDLIHVYSKRTEGATLAKLEISEEQENNFSNPDDDPRGPWTSTDMTAQNPDASKRKDQQYLIELPNKTLVPPPPGRCWAMLEPEFLNLKKQGRIWFGANGTARPRIKTYLWESKGISSWTWWSNDDVGHYQEAKKEVIQILGADKNFDYPKPVRLIERILELATSPTSLILDSFAGSGTTAHAVLRANKRDGGSRRFILIECQDYAETLTAERVRRVINGYTYQGVKRDELYSKRLTWSDFAKNQHKILDHVQGIENLQSHEYDQIKKEIKDGVLTITGERKVQEAMPPLRGSFTYCELGAPIEIESMLSGESMPSFEALARYVFYTVTGQTLDQVATPSPTGFIGETALFRVHLFYQPDRDWLRSNSAALDAERVELIAQNNTSGKRCIVFAVAKFMGQKALSARKIEFCQLPYAVHRLLGD